MQKVNEHATEGICLWPVLASISFAPDHAEGDVDCTAGHALPLS